MIQLKSLSITVASTTLLDSADAVLVEGDRVGLVGPNGCGKSTLLDILSHSDYDASSDAKQQPYWTVSSGSIDGKLSPSGRSVGSVLLVKQDVLDWSTLFFNIASEEELREYTIDEALDLAIGENLDCALDDEEAWRKLRVAANDTLCWNLADYEHTPLGRLSPGSALRLYLAIALQRRDIQLLLLDEPTNHLDLPSILWLQQSLVACGKTTIIVSHDEVFLDTVANHVWEVDAMRKSLTVSGAKYSAYKRAKLIAIEQQRQAFEKQQKRHKRLSAAADGLKSKSKAGERHQSRDHDLLQRDFKRDRAGRSAKRAAAVLKFRDSEEKVERVVEHVPLRIVLEPVAATSNESSILLDNVQLGYSAQFAHNEEIRLPIAPISLRVDYGERVAIIGFNAVGKSTLLKTICREVEAVGGVVTIGRDLRIGNLMQEHESLPRDVSPRDHLAAITHMDPHMVGNRVIGFGLSRYQVDAPIEQLNPGARARLLLATFALRNVNAMILDEPTNHLDEEAAAEVIATLNSYDGTIIVVSHDRDFLENLKLSRTLFLSTNGVQEVESVNAFVDNMDEIVGSVVAAMFG